LEQDLVQELADNGERLVEVLAARVRITGIPVAPHDLLLHMPRAWRSLAVP
jgi:hypothetical protein